MDNPDSKPPLPTRRWWLVVGLTLSLLALAVIWMISLRWNLTDVAYVSLSSSGDELIVVPLLQGCIADFRYSIDESSTEVRVSAEFAATGACGGDINTPLPVGVILRLEEPLGDRVLLNAATGEVVEAFEGLWFDEVSRVNRSGVSSAASR